MVDIQPEYLRALIEAADEVCKSWQFYPHDEYGSSEAICPTLPLIRLEEVLNRIAPE